MNADVLDRVALCADPSRYRYQRGCRCAGCREAQARYKREWLERKAASEGGQYGVNPCADCGTPISRLGAAGAKRYCASCAVERGRASRARDRANRREYMRLYLRDYYRKNRGVLLAAQREYREAHRDEIAAYFRQRHRATVRRAGRTGLRNARLRALEMEAAVADASPELRALIAEQTRDDRNTRATLANFMLSLDAPLGGSTKSTRSDFVVAANNRMVAWSRPTEDAAIESVGQWEALRDWAEAV